MAGNDELRAYCTKTILDGLNSKNALPIVVSYRSLFACIAMFVCFHDELLEVRFIVEDFLCREITLVTLCTAHRGCFVFMFTVLYSQM